MRALHAVALGPLVGEGTGASERLYRKMVGEADPFELVCRPARGPAAWPETNPAPLSLLPHRFLVSQFDPPRFFF